MSTHLEKALLHIRLASCSPKIEHFDEEYEQIIPRLWEQLKDANLFAEHEGGGAQAPELQPWRCRNGEYA